MVNLCEFENGELSAGPTRSLHKIPVSCATGRVGIRQTTEWKKEWHSRSLAPGEKNIINDPLVQRKKNIVIPPLHIKRGWVKQFVKALAWSQ